MTSRWTPGVVAAAALAVAMVGCRELAEPVGGVLSLSRVVLPSPGLVAGDSMRDSLGVVAPISVVAFDQDGDTIDPAPPATFVLFDAKAELVGDTLVGIDTGIVRVIATVAGLQTQIQVVRVTLRPDTIAATDSVLHRRRVDVLSGDTSFASADLGVIVQNRAGATPSGVDAVVVTYALTQVPPGGGSEPTVVFAGGTTAPVRDTTSGGGRAARQVRLRIVATPTLPDTAIVEAAASYRGQSLGTVQFVIVFQTQTP